MDPIPTADAVPRCARGGTVGAGHDIHQLYPNEPLKGMGNSGHLI